MLRILVLCLVAPSLLMPPGVCVCRPARGPTAGKEIVAAADHCPTSCCKKARHRTPPADRPAPQKDHNPSERPHLPGCPADLTVDHAKYVEPVNVFADTTRAMVFCPILPVVESPSVKTFPPDPVASPPAPRYISFRTLLV